MQLKEIEFINVTSESGIPQSNDTFNVPKVSLIQRFTI